MEIDFAAWPGGVIEGFGSLFYAGWSLRDRVGFFRVGGRGRADHQCCGLRAGAVPECGEGSRKAELAGWLWAMARCAQVPEDTSVHMKHEVFAGRKSPALRKAKGHDSSAAPPARPAVAPSFSPRKNAGDAGWTRTWGSSVHVSSVGFGEACLA